MWTGVQAEHLTPTGIALLIDFESLRRYVTILIIVVGEMWPDTGADETFTFSTPDKNRRGRVLISLSQVVLEYLQVTLKWAVQSFHLQSKSLETPPFRPSA